MGLLKHPVFLYLGLIGHNEQERKPACSDDPPTVSSSGPRYINGTHQRVVNKASIMNNNTLDFSGKVALVTGAASGMGLAAVQAFVEAGAAVVMADFREDAVKAEAQKLVVAGHRAMAVRCDVSDDAQVEQMVDHSGRCLIPSQIHSSSWCYLTTQAACLFTEKRSLGCESTNA